MIISWIDKTKTFLPGLSLAFIIALLSKVIESMLPIHLIGASIFALFIGMTINAYAPPGVRLKPGLKFTSKKVLRIAIILLGASLSINTVIGVGKLSMTVMLFTLFTCFGGGYLIGKLLGLDWKLSNLISAGTGICGGSAIAAVAPVIDADDQHIAYALSATFIFDMFMILLFPVMGKALNLSDIAYGLWAGTAVNDTSSVVAAGYAFSEAAGDFATMVKLTRTLSIIPVVIMFALINASLKKSDSSEEKSDLHLKDRVLNIFPWFILGFVLLAIVNSFGFIPPALAVLSKKLSKFLMVMALASIGLNTSFKEMRKSGAAPMLHGFIISALVVIVAITVEYFIGLV